MSSYRQKIFCRILLKFHLDPLVRVDENSVHQLLAQFDCEMVGGGDFLTDLTELVCRVLSCRLFLHEHAAFLYCQDFPGDPLFLLPEYSERNFSVQVRFIERKAFLFQGIGPGFSDSAFGSAVR